MKRFEFAIKALDNEILRVVGKVAMDYNEKGLSPKLACSHSKVKHLKEAIKILEDHERNKAV